MRICPCCSCIFVQLMLLPTAGAEAEFPAGSLRRKISHHSQDASACQEAVVLLVMEASRRQWCSGDGVVNRHWRSWRQWCPKDHGTQGGGDVQETVMHRRQCSARDTGAPRKGISRRLWCSRRQWCLLDSAARETVVLRQWC